MSTLTKGGHAETDSEQIQLQSPRHGERDGERGERERITLKVFIKFYL